MDTTKLKLIIIVLFFSIFRLHATSYYVSNTGNNSNDGLSPGNAFLTIQHAVDVLGTGDTVFVANGNYTGFDIREKNGTAALPIVFKALGNSVIINQSGPKRADGINVENCDYVIIDGFNCKDIPNDGNGIRIVLSDFCVVRNCRSDKNGRGIFTGFTDDIIIENNICSNSYDEHGIYVSNSSDRPIIRYNECYGNSNIGIHMNGDASMGEDGIIHDAQIYGNKLHDNNLAAGLNMDGVVGALIYNNLIYNNHNGQGIVLFKGDGAVVSSGAKIFNNTIIVPDDGRWGILLQEGANVNTQIFNNIIINLHSFRGCLGVRSTSQFSSDYNIFNNRLCTNGDDGPVISLTEWQSLGLDAHSMVSDALSDIFEDPGTNNYHLKSGSQAIEKGTDQVNAVVKNDIEGFSRPGGTLYDIGAYEFGSVLSVYGIENDYLIISPNPVSNYFTVTFKSNNQAVKHVELLDLNGRLVKIFTQNERFSIETITEGIYLIRVQTSDNQIIGKKILIKK